MIKGFKFSSWFKSISKQIQLGLVVVALFLIAPATIQKVFDIYQSLNPHLENRDVLATNSKLDLRYKLPNYSDVSWAKQHFEDRKKMKAEYQDFIVWRRGVYSSETINIGSDGLRRTYVPKDKDDQSTIWMFGGSTMWGNGVNDDNTIPSLLAKATGAQVKNFGEGGYIVRQELNTLNKAYSQVLTPTGNQNRIVIFYDGVNDGAGHCGQGNNEISTDRQNQIRTAFRSYFEKPSALTFDYLIQPAVRLVNKISIKIFGKNAKSREEFWSCDTVPEQADFIARSIVNDWISANAIAKARGDRFIAILQPVSFLSDSRFDHLVIAGESIEDLEAKGNQYKTVYPLIKKYASNANIEFYDFTAVFDLPEFIYIDYCHVSHQGNEIVAKKIMSILK